MMTEEIKTFINENKDLIKYNEWEEIYKKDFPEGFTETLLECGINPLKQGLDYMPKNFLYKSNIKEFIIPNNVTHIGGWAFYGCDNLTNIVIPNNITSMGWSTFFGCSNLTSVLFEENSKLTNIGSEAFFICYSLTSIKIPNGVRSIGSEVFYDCDSLTRVTIPNSVTSIGSEVFSSCPSLTSINYTGTKKEALTILKVSNKLWRKNSSISKIICTDGVIEL